MLIIIVVDCIVKSAPPQNANKHFSLSLSALFRAAQ